MILLKPDVLINPRKIISIEKSKIESTNKFFLNIYLEDDVKYRLKFDSEKEMHLRLSELLGDIDDELAVKL